MELPGDIDRVANACVEPVAAPWRVHVSALADQQHAPVGESIGDQHSGDPRIGRQDRVLGWLADEADNQLGDVGSTVIGLYAGEACPPDASQVNRPIGPVVPPPTTQYCTAGPR